MPEKTQLVLVEAVKGFLAAHPDSTLRLIMAIFLCSLGVTQATAAASSCVSTRYLRSRQQAFEANGLAGILPKPKSGRPPKLTPNVIGWISALVARLGSLSPGLICQRLAEEHHVKLCQKSIGKVIADYHLSDLLPQKSQEEVIGRTFWAGVWLLVPFLLEVMPKVIGPRTRQLFLTLMAMALVGIKRRFHLRDVHDVGLATLSGTPELLDGSTLRNRLRQLPAYIVDLFYRKTQPVQEFLKGSLWVSIDEHVVTRWTDKVRLAKTKHPTRGRLLPADKLFYAFELAKGKLLSLKVTRGSVRLSQACLSILRGLKATYRAKSLRVLLDAGAYKGSVFSRMGRMKWLTFLAKAISYPNSRKQWEQIPPEAYSDYIRPDERDSQNPKVYKIADWQTKIKGCGRPLRSIVILDPSEKKPAKKYTVLFTSDPSTPADKLADEYPLHWGQENCYRVMVHDLSLDALPKSYHPNDKQPDRPRFFSKELFFVAWVKALAYNLMVTFRTRLGGPYARQTVGTLVRKLLCCWATLVVSPTELKVIFDPFREQPYLQDYFQWVNSQRLKIPWLKDRVLVLQWAASPQEMPLGRRRILLFSG